MKYKTSIVICTKDREKILKNCLNSIFSQSIQPFEIIIVDDGALNKDYFIHLIEGHQIICQYLKKDTIGVALSRNLALEHIHGNIVLYLDDDTIIDPEYLEGIQSVYEKDEKLTIGGVTGVLKVNYKKGVIPFLRVFGLDSPSSGKILPSGIGVLVREGTIDKPINVDWLPGCNMSYRIQVFKDLRFDPGYPGNGWGGEDRDLSCNVSKSYKLIATPQASLIHLKDPTSRVPTSQFGLIETKYFIRFFMKNMPKDSYHWIALGWALTGIFLKNLFDGLYLHDRRYFEQAKGNIKGILSVL